MKDYIFSFTTTWHIPHDLETVWNRIAMVSEYPMWWPGMKRVEVLQERDLPVAVGNAFRFLVSSPLYQLSYTTTVTEYIAGKTIIAHSEGDLKGTGTWTFLSLPGETQATFVWEVSLTPYFLRLVSYIPFVRIIMRYFHNQLMRSGEHGLRQLLSKSSDSDLVVNI